MVYEVATFQALRELLRCKEIWVVGAEAWRNPEQDLPADFAQRRQEHYRELRKPLDPSVFIDQLCTEMTTALEQLDDALPGLDWLEVTDRASGPITLSKHEAAPEPVSLRRLKAEVGRRWGTVALIDVLKETVLAHRLPGPGQRRRRRRRAAGRRARRAADAGDLRLRHQHRHPRGRRRRRACPQRGNSCATPGAAT